MKTLLRLLAAFAIITLANGCASSSCCNHATAKGTTSSSRGPIISGYVDTSVGAKW